MATISNAKRYRHYGWLGGAVACGVIAVHVLFVRQWVLAVLLVVNALNFLRCHIALRHDRIEEVVFGPESIVIVGSQERSQSLPLAAIEEYAPHGESILVKYRKEGELEFYKFFESDFDSSAWKGLHEEIGRRKASGPG